MEPLFRGHIDERPTPLEKPLDNVNLNTITQHDAEAVSRAMAAAESKHITFSIT